MWFQMNRERVGITVHHRPVCKAQDFNAILESMGWGRQGNMIMVQSRIKFTSSDLHPDSTLFGARLEGT